MAKNVSKNRLVTAWTSFITTTAIFMLIGFLIFYDPVTLIPWWCWFVPAITFVEAIRVTIRYMAGENTRICPNCHGKTPISNQFCDKCGHDLRAVTYENYGQVEEGKPASEVTQPEPPKPVSSPGKYCVTCGGPLEGSEQYCPTCGMPLKN